MDPTAATDPALDFQGRSFCFTGKLAELKRTRAEREARARGGLTGKVVNGELDYLVVGSIPATGWKHGSYGNKIEKARRLRTDGCGLRPDVAHPNGSKPGFRFASSLNNSSDGIDREPASMLIDKRPPR